MKVMRVTPAITVDRFPDYEVLVREITHEFGTFAGKVRDVFILEVELIDTKPPKRKKDKIIHGIKVIVTELRIAGDKVMEGNYPTGIVGVTSGLYMLRIDAPKFYEFLEDVGWLKLFESISDPIDPDVVAAWTPPDDDTAPPW